MTASPLPHLHCPHLAPPAGADFWRDIALVSLKENVTGAAPAQPAWFKTAWTDSELRIVFHCADTRPWATHTAHDAPLWEEEVVEVFLDPAGDLQSYFEIEINPLNAVCDLVLRRSRGGWLKDFAWHCAGLQTSVKQTPGVWIAELAIPFAALGPSLPLPGKPWRANFYRIDRPQTSPWELSAWSPTGRELFHIPEKFGFLDFTR
jgi:hypothetical protein